ncbi:hypothetical protein CHLRE_03g177476v5 [Chlamydomonas reinhardtii]|uniref:Uncharacterized protein n=1 Tax=Chlamydomonas reinhardtii TaxID=3055 RepID=A0A2K3DXH7_CHLRE|nr:uncharacterized protein CHLRE_03g177476v5 [Chlamydomonas reinhardtii]PNW85239.1 hypothetical protein CHLRE_03g177476v5 [Chlamydomonas reinhardtii]
MANNLQRQGRSARLVERRSSCTDKLLAQGGGCLMKLWAAKRPKLGGRSHTGDTRGSGYPPTLRP